MPLTVRKIESAGPGRLSDGKGLYLLVKPRAADPAKGGARSWVLRVQHKGVRRDIGLGSYSPRSISSDYEALPIVRRKLLTLEEARKKAEAGRLLAKSGIDPVAEWRRHEVVVPTFEVAAREYHRSIVMANAAGNAKHKAQWLTTLESYAFPVIGKLLVSDITASDIQAVLNPIWLVVPETARRVRQRIFVILDYCRAKEWRESEAPARAVSQLMKRIAQPRGGNFEALPWSELPALMEKLRDGDLSMGRVALQFLILTASRSGEVRGATWQEIDVDAGEWKIPASRMKGRKLHIVPLVPAALDLLKQARATHGAEPHQPVFPGMRGKPMSDATLAKVMRTAGGGSATVHGLRSTFRDWAAETGFANDWAEAALAHSVAGQEGKTAAAYKRTTFYAQRRDTLMPAWAGYALQYQAIPQSRPRQAASGASVSFRPSL